MTEGLINILSWNIIDFLHIFCLLIFNSVDKNCGTYWKKQKSMVKFTYEG